MSRLLRRPFAKVPGQGNLSDLALCSLRRAVPARSRKPLRMLMDALQAYRMRTIRASRTPDKRSELAE